MDGLSTRSCRDLEQESLPASVPIAQIREAVHRQRRVVWHAVCAGQVSRQYLLINISDVLTISICYYRAEQVNWQTHQLLRNEANKSFVINGSHIRSCF